MKSVYKWTGIVLLFAVIIGLLVWSDRSEPVAPAAAMTAEEVEMQSLIAKIASGSLLWRQAKAQEDTARAERIRQEQGNAGYRYTLCTKFSRVVDASGKVQLLDGTSQCQQGF